jgi:hypothetical protein
MGFSVCSSVSILETHLTQIVLYRRWTVTISRTYKHTLCLAVTLKSWGWIKYRSATCGSVVVKTIWYKPKDHGFETWWGELIFSSYLILPASNRNEYQKQNNKVSGEVDCGWCNRLTILPPSVRRMSRPAMANWQPEFLFTSAPRQVWGLF